MIPISDSHPAGRFPLINILLIAATIFVFFQQLIAVNPDAFILQYALIPSQIDLSNYQTLTPFVTAIFLHGGFLHIISNMLFLWVFGDNVEGYLNIFTYAFLYFAAGIAGNLAQYFFMPESSIPMLGASGAVAGVLGAYFVFFPHHKVKTLVPFFGFISVVEIPAGFMLGYWFLLQILSGALTIPMGGETGGVAFWAHVGGFVTGMVLGNLLRFRQNE